MSTSASSARLVPDLGKFWTIPNTLSLLRLALVPPLAYLIFIDGSKSWIFGLAGAAILSDWIDGKVARWSKSVSEWGKVLDPMADKFAAATVTLALVLRGSLPLWFLLIVVIRDLVIVAGGVVLARRTGRILMSIWTGKLAVGALALTVLAALLEADPPVMQVCIAVTTVLMVYALILYVVRFARTLRASTPPLTDAELDGDDGSMVLNMPEPPAPDDATAEASADSIHRQSS